MIKLAKKTKNLTGEVNVVEDGPSNDLSFLLLTTASVPEVVGNWSITGAPTGVVFWSITGIPEDVRDSLRSGGSGADRALLIRGYDVLLAAA